MPPGQLKPIHESDIAFRDAFAASLYFDFRTVSSTGSSPRLFLWWRSRMFGADLGTGAMTGVSNNGMQRSPLRAAADAETLGPDLSEGAGDCMLHPE